MSLSYEEPWVDPYTYRMEDNGWVVPESPNDLDGCAGIMFGALLGFIFFAFVVVACLSVR